MQTAIYSWKDHQLEQHPLSMPLNDHAVQLVLCFGAKTVLASGKVYTMLKDKFPNADIVICSTSGEIYHTTVQDDSLSITAIQFESTTVRSHHVDISDFENSYEAGKALLKQFDIRELSYVMVLSDGGKVNGSELVRGMNEITQQKILVTGGLAGDASNFKATLTGINQEPVPGAIVAIGFYGDKLKVGHSSKGGWEMFGLEKQVTRSENNVLFEINDKNALGIYKQYLGSEAATLPGSALLFPLAVRQTGENEPIVRTILSIDELAGSMTFAGDIPEGSMVRFMKANFDKLINAAAEAASQATGDQVPQLALLISCVGRKLILQSRTEEEVEAVDEKFGCKTLLTGFYSYGEISPFVSGSACRLHNQTMTITTFYEAE